MKWAQLLVRVMSVECLGASVAYGYQGNWKMSAYWFLVCLINAILSTM